MVSFNISRLNQNFITAIAKKGLNEFTFVFAYAPPTQHQRTRFWREIGLEIGSIRGGFGLLHQDSHTFQELVDEVGILDMGFTGQPHTWSKGAPAASFVTKKLDRIFMSIGSFISWPNASVLHLPKFGSDHTPLLFELEPRGRARNDRRPFRFEAMWLTHPDFLSFIRDSWRAEASTNDALRILKHKLLRWNKVVFGDLHEKKKKNRLVAQFDDLQTLIQAAPADSIIAQEAAANGS
ncbi:hypothetical protein V2J09_014468 [Rumex salicifolius]